MSQDMEREAFEAWVNKQPEAQGMRKRWWCRQIDDGGYSCHEPDVMWRAWQARAALASQQAGKGEREKAYDMIDRCLRNNLDDEVYADHSKALEELFRLPSARQVTPVAWRSAEQYSPDVGSWYEYYDEYRSISPTDGLTPLYASPPSREVEPLTESVLLKLLAAALGALRYHTEQTRPIQRTKEIIRAIEHELTVHGIHSRGEGEKA